MKRLITVPNWVAWGLALPLILLNGWALFTILGYFGSIAVKFVTAMLLAFVLSYPVDLLQRMKVPRARAVFWVMVATLSILLVLGFTLVPALVEQADELATRLPTWIDSGGQQLQTLQAWAETRHLPIDMSKFILQLENRLAIQLQALSGEVLNVLLNAISSVLNLMLTVVLTFYLLLHGDRLWNGIFQWFPERIGPQIRQAFRQNFQNYFIGQATLALLMGTAMIIAFLIIRVPFGLLFGLGVGLLTLFPFGASLGIVLVSLLTALKSIWLGLRVLAIATIIDQLIESGIAPQLIGGFTGLNPVWILMSLFVGAKIGGLIGLVIAVPLASSLKTIADQFRSLQSEALPPSNPVVASEMD